MRSIRPEAEEGCRPNVLANAFAGELGFLRRKLSPKNWGMVMIPCEMALRSRRSIAPIKVGNNCCMSAANVWMEIFLFLIVNSSYHELFVFGSKKRPGFQTMGR